MSSASKLSASKLKNRVVKGLAGLALVGALFAAVSALQALPDGPVAVTWDREACAHCHMHVGDPAFAAQLQTLAGEVLNFDDPGCLFGYLEARRPAVHAIYFHHGREDRWIAGDEAGFVPASPTPMGYGLAAVTRETPGSIPMKAAMAKLARGDDAAAPSDGLTQGGR